MPVNRLTIESATATATHTSTPVDVSGITGDYTVKLLVTQFNPPYYGGSARILIEESADGFSTARTLAVFNFSTIFPSEGQIVSFRKRDAAGTDLFGTAGAECRLNLAELNASSPSISYESWIEY